MRAASLTTNIAKPFSQLRGATQAVRRFFLEPASARPLAALRIGLAAVLLTQAFLLRGEALDLFGSRGLVQGRLAEYLSYPHTPRIAWFQPFFSSLGMSEASGIYFVCGLYLLCLVLFGIGWQTRATTVGTWFLHWVLMNTGYTTNYGADLFAHVYLFYLMWMPAGAAWSLDSALGKTSTAPSADARLALRVLQLHLCLAYLASGIEKASGIQWWNGELLWRALNLPIYQQFDFSWLSQLPILSKVGGWTTLVFELGFCVFIWPKASRRFWIASMVGLHLGIAIFLGLGVFGALMCVLSPALFAVSAEAGPALAWHTEWVEKANRLPQHELEREVAKINPRAAVRESIKPTKQFR